MGSFSYINALSAPSKVFDAEEKTFLTDFGTRDATTMIESSFNKLRFSCEKNPCQGLSRSWVSYPLCSAYSYSRSLHQNSAAVNFEEQMYAPGVFYDQSYVYLLQIWMILGMALFKYLH